MTGNAINGIIAGPLATAVDIGNAARLRSDKGVQICNRPRQYVLVLG